jgi:hypothetical protein
VNFACAAVHARIMTPLAFLTLATLSMHGKDPTSAGKNMANIKDAMGKKLPVPVHLRKVSRPHPYNMDAIPSEFVL